jgi:hypothetical protein
MKDKDLINYTELSKELKKLISITEKLDYLNEYQKNKVSDDLFNIQKHNLHTIIETLESKHFKDCHTNPEFTFWFLKYNAEKIFDTYISQKEFINKIESIHKNKSLQAILNEIINIETKADELLLKNKINYYDKYNPNGGYLDFFPGGNVPEIEYFRVTDIGYYTNHPTPNSYTVIFSPEVNAYFRHIILKPYLEGELKKVEDVNTERQQRDDTLTKKNKAISGKYYALYHWILIEMGIEKPFEYDKNDKYPKSEIKAFAENRYKETSAEMFYREFTDLNIKDKNAIAYAYGKDYKKTIYSLSNNNAKVINYLKKFPN